MRTQRLVQFLTLSTLFLATLASSAVAVQPEAIPRDPATGKIDFTQSGPETQYRSILQAQSADQYHLNGGALILDVGIALKTMGAIHFANGIQDDGRIDLGSGLGNQLSFTTQSTLLKTSTNSIATGKLPNLVISPGNGILGNNPLTERQLLSDDIDLSFENDFSKVFSNASIAASSQVGMPAGLADNWSAGFYAYFTPIATQEYIFRAAGQSGATNDHASIYIQELGAEEGLQGVQGIHTNTLPQTLIAGKTYALFFGFSEGTGDDTVSFSISSDGGENFSIVNPTDTSQGTWWLPMPGMDSEPPTFQAKSIEVQSSTSLKVNTLSAGHVETLSFVNPEGSNTEALLTLVAPDERIANINFDETLLEASATRRYGINVDESLNLGTLGIVGDGDATFVKQGEGIATANLTGDTASRLTLVLEGGALRAEVPNAINLSIKNAEFRGGAIGTNGLPLIVENRLTIGQNNTFSLAVPTTVGQPGQLSVVLEGDNAVLDLSNAKALFSYSGTLGDGRGVLLYDAGGFAGGDTLTDNVNVGTVQLANNPQLHFSTGSHLLAAQERLELGDLVLEVTDGAVAVRGDDVTKIDAAKSLVLLGGTSCLQEFPADLDTRLLTLAAEPALGGAATEVSRSTLDLAQVTASDPTAPVEFAKITLAPQSSLGFANAATVRANHLNGTGGELRLDGTEVVLGEATLASHTFAGCISDENNTGKLTKVGSNTQILTGASTHKRTLIKEGTLQLGDWANNAGASGSLAGDVEIQAATLAIARSDEHRIVDVVGTLSGDGTLAINNAETGFTAITSDTGVATVINSGALQIGDNAGTPLQSIDPGNYTFQGTGELALRLPATGFSTSDTPRFNLQNVTLRLRGDYNYTDATVEKIAAGGASLAALRVDTDANLTIKVLSSNIQDTPLTVRESIAINPASLTVDASSFTLKMDYDGRFPVLHTDSLTHASGNVPWSFDDGYYINTVSGIDDPRYVWYYERENGTLYGQLSEAKLPKLTNQLTNSEALRMIFENPALKGSQQEQFRYQLIALSKQGATAEQLDAIVQQFTPSMSSTSYANSATTCQEIMRQVRTQIGQPVGMLASIDDTGINGERLAESEANASRRGQGGASLKYRPASSSLFTMRQANHFWFQAFGWGGEQVSQDGFAGYDTTGWGIASGIDRQFNNRLLLGLSYAYTDNNLVSKSWQTLLGTTADPSRVNTKNFSLLAYGRYDLNSKVYATVMGGGVWGDITGTRRPTNTTFVEYTTNSSTMLLQTELAYHLYTSCRWTITPRLCFNYFNFMQAAYQERVGSSTNEIDNFTDSYYEAGALFDTVFNCKPGMRIVTTLGYKGILGSDGNVLRVESDGLSYNIAAIKPSTGVFVGDVGAMFELTEKLAVTGEYNFRLGDGGSTIHGGTATLVWGF